MKGYIEFLCPVYYWCYPGVYSFYKFPPFYSEIQTYLSTLLPLLQIRSGIPTFWTIPLLSGQRKLLLILVEPYPRFYTHFMFLFMCGRMFPLWAIYSSLQIPKFPTHLPPMCSCYVSVKIAHHNRERCCSVLFCLFPVLLETVYGITTVVIRWYIGMDYL